MSSNFPSTCEQFHTVNCVVVCEIDGNNA